MCGFFFSVTTVLVFLGETFALGYVRFPGVSLAVCRKDGVVLTPPWPDVLKDETRQGRNKQGPLCVWLVCSE